MQKFALIILFLLKYIFEIESTLPYGYYDYHELTEILHNYANVYPDKAHLYTIGQTVKGRELWVLALSGTKPNESVPLRPEGKYIGNIHGNEASGKAILLQFIDHLLTNSNDPDVDYLMKNTRIHILPSMNADGYEISHVNVCNGTIGRNNVNNYNLNRNFQDLFECNNVPLQPETLAIMHWLKENKFIISASLHSGTIVANFPYDNYINGSYLGSMLSLADENELFESMAKTYSFNHGNMKDDPCKHGFVDGVTNGG